MTKYAIIQIINAVQSRHMGVVDATSKQQAILLWLDANRSCGLPDPSGELIAETKHLKYLA